MVSLAQGDQRRNTPHLYEDDLKRHFITALSQLLTDRTALLEDGRLIRNELLDFTAIDTECASILKHLQDLSLTNLKP